MGKQGPCYHCGVTSTPLWRNGPPEKPVLCNACGSRWRTKGTLTNYTPLHARAEANDYDDHRFARVKSMSVNKNKEMKTLKRKPDQENVIVKRTDLEPIQGFRKFVDEDTSNRSSSGSAVSNSESCAQFGSADGSDLTGPAQSNVWDTMVPSKKRTCVGRPKPSSVEKLTKDLYNILQEQQSSCFSCSSEEDLLFESERPMVSVEIGHGSVLMRHPHSRAREEESEGSSLSVENKNSISEAYSRSMELLTKNDIKGVNFPIKGAEKTKYFGGQGVQQEQLKRNKSQNEKQVLGSYSSPLSNIDLKDIFNFEVFVGQFTTEEQQHLKKFLPPQDTVKLPDSLRNMFDSRQFEENFSFFQQLLAEGVFDTSFSGEKLGDSKTLRKLALSDMKISHLVESYSRLKKCKTVPGDSAPKGTNPDAPCSLLGFKGSSESKNQKFSEASAMMRSPKTVITTKPNYETKETTMNNDVSCFSPRSLFVFPPVDISEMFGYGDSDQDILLDVPSNGSFPQAELLSQL